MKGEQDALWFRETFEKVRDQIGRVIVGQSDIVDGVLVGLAANGHVLLEGMPGLGKTLLVKSLAEALDLTFGRIQFTPDLMPADVTGTNVMVMSGEHRSFEFRKGPIFANLVLADEINRATPKTQSSMLEAMQERRVTIGSSTHGLEEPFLVMATQNPIEQEGTYPLPEAQLDRFFFKLLVPYPTKEDLREIATRTTGLLDCKVEPVANAQDVIQMRTIAKEAVCDSRRTEYAIDLVMGTHPEGPGSTEISRKYCRYGSSPRGVQALITAAKINALLAGRFNVDSVDIQKSLKPALRHRLLLNFEAEADGMNADRVLSEIQNQVDSNTKDPIGV